MKKSIWISTASLLTAVIGLLSLPACRGNPAGPQLNLPQEGTAMSQPLDTLKIIGPAPEWENEVWINTERPLPLVDLRGKVVLLEMWTFG
jgi:hypothetical protein